MDFTRTYNSFLRTPWIGKKLLLYGVLGNGIIFLYSATYLTVPRGTYIRDMPGALLIFISGIMTFMLTFPISVSSFKTCEKWVGITGIIMSVTPIPVGIVWLNLVAFFCGLKIEQ